MIQRKRRRYYRFLSAIISFVMILVSIPSATIFAIDDTVKENTLSDDIITAESITSTEPIDDTAEKRRGFRAECDHR